MSSDRSDWIVVFHFYQYVTMGLVFQYLLLFSLKPDNRKLKKLLHNHLDKQRIIKLIMQMYRLKGGEADGNGEFITKQCAGESNTG